MTLRPFRDNYPTFSNSVFIDETALVIGEVELHDDVSIWPMAVVRGDIYFIQIGARTNIQDGAILHVVHDYEFCPGGAPVIIGEETTVGHGAILHGCRIGNACLIGMNATILDHTEIGDEVIIGANSLVPQHKKLESGYLYFGNPVKQIRPLTEEEKAHIRLNAQFYVDWKNDHYSP